VDLKQLKCFVAVADNLHFGQAAQRLNMLPSALSRQIRLLEEDVGVRLLVRSTRHVRLTEAGAVLVDEARTILQSARQWKCLGSSSSICSTNT
jgi:DNA-binding transcriptional LysR family regulator